MYPQPGSRKPELRALSEHTLYHHHPTTRTSCLPDLDSGPPAHMRAEGCLRCRTRCIMLVVRT